MKRKLSYRNAIFGTYALYHKNTPYYPLEENEIESLEHLNNDNIKNIVSVNICKKHVKQYGLYNEIGLTEEQTKNFRRFIIDGSICCIEGCNCDRVWDININTKECELVI